MSSKAMSLKGRINHYAKKNNIAAQVVLQNYMFERFLERLSKSEYQEKFVIKGGMLVAAIVGLDTRSTMDLDTTLRNLPLTEEQITQAIQSICGIDLKDEVAFKVVSVASIRKDDRYGGFCIRMDAVYDTIVTPLSIDISTGDVITPSAVLYEFSSIFDESVRIRLWGYNIETVMAEKVETILSRGSIPAASISSTIQYQEPIVSRATGEPGSWRERNSRISPFLCAIRCSMTRPLSWSSATA